MQWKSMGSDVILKKDEMLCSAKEKKVIHKIRRKGGWVNDDKIQILWMNCSFKFVVFLRSSVLRINGVCSALMTACSRADANVRCNLLLLITLFFNCAHSPFLSLSLSLSPSVFSFHYVTEQFHCKLLSFLSAIQYLDAWLHSHFFYLQIYVFKLTLVVVHSGISSSGLLFALVCHNRSLFKVMLM